VNQSYFQSAWLDGVGTKGSEWQYPDGTPWDYTNWGPGQPDNQGGNEHCQTMVGPS
jgi:hypothetical protein